ncbi:hypothetical protein VTK26DRAFT_1725 [Humicola hyalothermophila]
MHTPRRDHRPKQGKQPQRPDRGVGHARGVGGDEHKEEAEGGDVGHALDPDGPAVGKDKGRPDAARGHLVGAQEQVERVLAGAVEEVVAAVAGDGDVGVLQGAGLGAPAEAGQVRLHGARARVALGDDVGVVGPHVAEEQLKGRVLVGEAPAAREQAQVRQHAVERPAGEHALHDVGAVQAVHAVGAHHARLQVAHLEPVARPPPARHVGRAEVLLREQRLVHAVDEQLRAMHLKTLGFGVEVKVDVVQPVELGPGAAAARLDGVEFLVGPLVGLDVLLGVRDEYVDHLLIGLLDAHLAALLVDQVDEVVVAVEANLLVKVSLGGGEGCLDGADLERRRVLERVDLGPVGWHAAAGLNVGQDLHVLALVRRVALPPRASTPRDAAQPCSGIVEDQDLFCLVVVRSVPLVVQAACEVPGASSVAGPARDQSYGQGRPLEGGRVDLEHAKDDGEDIRINVRLGRWLPAAALCPEVDQVGLDESVPEEAVVGALPQRAVCILLCLALEAVCEVDRI